MEYETRSEGDLFLNNVPKGGTKYTGVTYFES